jgi:hypothetical protein
VLFFQKSPCAGGAKEGMVSEEISTIKNKPILFTMTIGKVT